MTRVKEKPYRAKSLRNAEREVRMLRRRTGELTRLLEEYHADRLLMARLAADGPAFENPIVVSEAKARRDKLLRE